MARRFVLAVAAMSGTAIGCTGYVRPGAPTPSMGIEIPASFGSTWEAVVDLFTEQNVGVRTLDLSSGLVVAEKSLVVPRMRSPMRRATPESEAAMSTLRWADCGQRYGNPIFPTIVSYSVVVRGDSVRAFVRANAEWRNSEAGAVRPCVTRGVWESNFEKQVRDLVTRRTK
jgi:hypothetical protein